MKVLFVCTGNICRSPVAERMLQQRSNELGLGLTVSSAGTRALNGKPMHPESVRVLRDRGLEPAHFMSRLLTGALVTDADVVLGLTRDHRAVARQLAPVRWRTMFALREVSIGGANARTARADRLVSTLSVDPTDSCLDIDDPIGRSADVFDRVAEDIEGTMDGLVAWLELQLIQHNTVKHEAK